MRGRPIFNISDQNKSSTPLDQRMYFSYQLQHPHQPSRSAHDQTKITCPINVYNNDVGKKQTMF